MFNMNHILIGTSGYSYADWVGPVYPEGTGQKDFLRLYAARFPTVELNFSYYAMPREAQLAKMLLEGGSHLSFSIKAHESLTHKITGAWREGAKTFIRALEPLRQAERLDAVLFQFPYSFHYEPENRRYLDNVLGAFAGIPTAVEFRNADWQGTRVIEGLRQRGAALVSVDLPQLRGLPPEADEVTVPLAYLRLHGKNKAAWWEGDNSSRYNYLYSRDELETVEKRITWIADKAGRVLIYFNNHPLGQAVINAETLWDMLGKRKKHLTETPAGVS